MQAGTMMLTYLFPQNAKFLQLLLHVTTPNPEFVRVGTPIVFRDGSAGAENLGVGVGVVTALCSWRREKNFQVAAKDGADKKAKDCGPV